MTCKHDIAEQDTYVADGYCPLCLLDQIQRLQARVDELEAVVREAYEVWAGSDGLMQPATAPEAYVIRLIDQMATILGKALTNSEEKT